MADRDGTRRHGRHDRVCRSADRISDDAVDICERKIDEDALHRLDQRSIKPLIRAKLLLRLVGLRDFIRASKHKFWHARNEQRDLQTQVEHIDIVLNRDVRSRTATGLECMRFAHVALPEFALSDVDINCTVLSRQMRAPIIISSMTGGPKRSESINAAIANACERHGIGLGLGSQQIALAGNEVSGFDGSSRESAPSVPILANLGSMQMQWNGPDMTRSAKFVSAEVQDGMTT